MHLYFFPVKNLNLKFMFLKSKVIIYALDKENLYLISDLLDLNQRIRIHLELLKISNFI